jgi:hypothetical protein
MTQAARTSPTSEMAFFEASDYLFWSEIQNTRMRSGGLPPGRALRLFACHRSHRI